MTMAESEDDKILYWNFKQSITNAFAFIRREKWFAIESIAYTWLIHRLLLNADISVKNDRVVWVSSVFPTMWFSSRTLLIVEVNRKLSAETPMSIIRHRYYDGLYHSQCCRGSLTDRWCSSVTPQGTESSLKFKDISRSTQVDFQGRH